MTAPNKVVPILLSLLLLAAPVAGTPTPLHRRKRRQAQQIVNFKVTDTKNVHVSDNVVALKPKQEAEMDEQDEFWSKYVADVSGSSFTEAPTKAPTPEPTPAPTPGPTERPSETPSIAPSDTPSDVPSDVPSESPSDAPSESPSSAPTGLCIVEVRV